MYNLIRSVGVHLLPTKLCTCNLNLFLSLSQGLSPRIPKTSLFSLKRYAKMATKQSMFQFKRRKNTKPKRGLWSQLKGLLWHLKSQRHSIKVAFTFRKKMKTKSLLKDLKSSLRRPERVLRTPRKRKKRNLQIKRKPRRMMMTTT